MVETHRPQINVCGLAPKSKKRGKLKTRKAWQRKRGASLNVHQTKICAIRSGRQTLLIKRKVSGRVGKISLEIWKKEGH